MFLVLAVKKSMTIQVAGLQLLDLDFAQAGYLGMCPVFETLEEAKKWADGKAKIIRIEVES